MRVAGSDKCEMLPNQYLKNPIIFPCGRGFLIITARHIGIIDNFDNIVGFSCLLFLLEVGQTSPAS